MQNNDNDIARAGKILRGGGLERDGGDGAGRELEEDLAAFDCEVELADLDRVRLLEGVERVDVAVAEDFAGDGCLCSRSASSLFK